MGAAFKEYVFDFVDLKLLSKENRIMKPEMIEGPEAKLNFEQRMKKLFRISKPEVKQAEKKYKTNRNRKKH